MLEERKPFLKTYNVLLTTKSPVHIGSGDSYFPFLYIKQSDNKLMVFDEEEVLTKLSELGKSEEFNKIIKSNKGDNNKMYDDIRLLYENKITGKQISCEPNVLRNNPDIARTMYSNDGRPYIPGSSVKGSIRTAYLAYKKRQFENNNDNSSIIEGKRLNAMNDKQKFSVELDPFKFLKVSDFISLDFDNNTEIRAEYNLMKTGKNISSLANGAVLEVIPSGKKFLGIITLYDPLKSNTNERLLENDLKNSIIKFFSVLFSNVTNTEYLDKHRNIVLVKSPIFSGNDEIGIQIGKHSGAEAVSFNKELRSVKIRLEGRNTKIDNEAYTIWVSKDNDNEYEFFSWCSLKFISSDEAQKLKDEMYNKQSEILASKRQAKVAEMLKLKEKEETARQAKLDIESQENKFIELKNCIKDNKLLDIINDIEQYNNNVEKRYNSDFRRLNNDEKELVAPFFDKIFKKKDYYNNPKYKFSKKTMLDDIKKYLK